VAKYHRILRGTRRSRIIAANHWWVQIILHTCFKALFPVIFHRMRRHPNNNGAASINQSFIFSQFAKYSGRAPTVLDNLLAISFMSKNLFKYQLINLIVFGNQHLNI